MPTIVGEMTRGAVFNYLVELGGVGAATPTAKTLSSDRLALTTNKSVYVVSAESGSTDDIDGISGYNEGQLVILLAATGHTLTLKDENGGAAAAGDRLRLPGGKDVIVREDEAAFFYHDPTLSRWVFLGGSATTQTHGNSAHNETEVLHSLLFVADADSLAANALLPVTGICVGESGEHGTYTALRGKAVAKTAGSGTNTLIIEGSADPNFATNNTIVTIALGASREADNTSPATWQSGDIFVRARCTEANTSPPVGVTVQFFFKEEVF